MEIVDTKPRSLFGSEIVNRNNRIDKLGIIEID